MPVPSSLREQCWGRDRHVSYSRSEALCPLVSAKQRLQRNACGSNPELTFEAPGSAFAPKQSPEKL